MAATMSIIALVLSIVAVVVAVLALSKSGGSTPAAVQQAPATALMPAPEGPSGATPIGPGTEGSGADTSGPGAIPTITPVGDYTPAYQDERLRAESNYCGPTGQVGIDLDLPQVGAGNVDIRYVTCESGTILTTLQAAKVSGPDATPVECIDKIRTQPIQNDIPVAKDITICFRTDRDRARLEATTQKIVLMTVTGVSPSTGQGSIINFTLNGWNVP